MNESSSRGQAGAAAVRPRSRTRPPLPAAYAEPRADVARLQTRCPPRHSLVAALCAKGDSVLRAPRLAARFAAEVAAPASRVWRETARGARAGGPQSGLTEAEGWARRPAPHR